MKLKRDDLMPAEIIQKALKELPRICPECNGKGFETIPMSHPSNPNLDWWEDKKCRKCNGTGFLRPFIRRFTG